MVLVFLFMVRRPVGYGCARGRPEKQRVALNKPRLPRILSQEEAAIYCPENGHIWINNQKRSFHGHLEKSEYKRVYANYSEDNVEHESVAMRSVLQQLWVQYNEMMGHAKYDCPFNGVF